ncbi:hypothetical protein MPSEU_000435200 [Mayamaea pseudoterrestris]|nr:hypothetical protein MPSEU_000435200 [Mayamaea pseudoterrestris]
MAPPASNSAETAARIKGLLKEVPDPKFDVVRLDDLRKVFAGLIQSGELQLGGAPLDELSPVQQKWNAFLTTSHKRMVQQLMKRVMEGKRAAIRTFWGVIATSPVWSNNRKYQLLSAPLLLQWIRAMSQVPVMDKSVRHMVEVEFLGSYRDVQYYAMIAIRECANELLQSADGQEVQDKAERLVQILSMIPIPASQDELDESPNYLFQPPDDASGDEDNESDSDSAEEEECDDDDASDSASDDESSDDGPVTAGPPQKKQKVAVNKFTYQRVQSHHRVWAKAWLAVLKTTLPLPALKQALQFLPQSVLPNVAHPLQFSDFFMSAYDSTGVVPIMALDGLFILITKHGLEYKNFYKQLYRLITPSLLYVKYRTRFFTLLDKCLSRNDMLPAHIVAAFCKRLLRCSLQGPPSSILFILALCSNLMRKHPEVSCLIHRQEDLEDGFDAKVDDPEQANALQSSLWEIYSLEKHYYPPVVTLAKSFGRAEELKAPLYNLTDDFLGYTYKSLFDQERKRPRKGKAPLAFKEPTSLFTNDDVFSGILAIDAD